MCLRECLLKPCDGGRGPFNEQNMGGNVCVCVCGEERNRGRTFIITSPVCRGAMALHIKSLVESFIRDRLLVCVHSLFFLLCFIIRHFLDWRASCLDRIASDISAGEFFLRFFFYFVCAFFNTGSDKVALQHLIVKKHTALSSPFPFLSSFLAIER